VATIDTPKDAERLARAIVADVLLYNEEGLIQGFEQGRPLQNLAAELGDAKALYDSRVSAVVRAQGPLFACVFEQLIERWAIGRRLPVSGIAAASAAVFGEQPQAVAAFRQGGGTPASRPPGPGPSSTPRPVRPSPTATPVAPPSAARLPARSPWCDGFLVLEPQALCFERAEADRPGSREELPLADLHELRLRRLQDGTWDLAVATGEQSGSWTLNRVEDTVTVARHVLARIGRPPG
jgi:hypothetical protein